MPLRVACLGPEGTVSHEALELASNTAGFEVEPLLTPTIHHAVAALTAGEADFALVPLENSLEGGVVPTLDELLAREGTTPIVGELVHSVQHRLIAKSPISVSEIDEVFSLPFVAAQCGPWLKQNLPDVQITQAHSTADAVKTMSEAEGNSAALGTELAARIYGCSVIVEQVDEGENTTRFVWLSNDPNGPLPPGTSATHRMKTSIVFWGSGAEEPGWLVDCLGEFGGRGVNLTRIESRPRRDELGSYVFFADLDGDSSSDSVNEALTGVAAKADAVILLGSYPAA